MKIGDLVWAKLKGFPSWPAKIVQPPSGAAHHKSKMSKLYVNFFGSNTCAWVSIKNITLHTPDLLKEAYAKKSPSFKKAVKALLLEDNDTHPPKMESGIIKQLLHQYKIKNCEVRLKRIDSSSLQYNGIASNINLKDKDNPNITLPNKILKTDVMEDLKQCVNISENSIQSQCIKKIGFIGFEAIGMNIAKHLLKAGHKIIIQNQDSELCKQLIKEGANIALSSVDIVATCNIIICCLSDQESVESILHSEENFLNGFSSVKGYIELTHLSKNFSNVLAKEIRIRGGKYLEASVFGSEPGNLFTLASGDEALFNECEFNFGTLGEFKYLGPIIGLATNFNLIMSLFLENRYALYEESRNLARGANLPLNILDELFSHKFFNDVKQMPQKNSFITKFDLGSSIIRKYLHESNMKF